MDFIKKLAFSLTCILCLNVLLPQNAVGQVVQNDVILSLQSNGEESNEITITQKWGAAFIVDINLPIDQQPFVQVYGDDGQPLGNKVLLSGSSVSLTVPKQEEYHVVITASMASIHWYLPGI